MNTTVTVKVDPKEVLRLDGELAWDYLERKVREKAIQEGYSIPPGVGERLGGAWSNRINFHTYLERDPDAGQRPMYIVQLRFNDRIYPQSGVE